ncbi:MAG TPA: hypothetical protein VKR06_42230 [Ktedonosporobacter sp.]|nr:hypothetical protein [Ktedonosporobacter sp.]
MCESMPIVRNDNGDASSLLGTSYSGTNLLAEHISSTSQGHTAIEPAITPVKPDQSRRLSDSLQEPQPGVVHVVLFETTHV